MPADALQPTRPDRRGERGMSLVELMMATVLIVVGLVAITDSCLRLHSLQRVDGELDLAARACRDQLEQLRMLPFVQLPARDGTGFDVAGPDGTTPLLLAKPDDADGRPGSIVVRQVRVAGSRRLYQLEAAVDWQGATGAHSIRLTTLFGGAP